MARQRRRKKLDNKGFTLVELVACFAVLGIFMVAATMLITSSSNVYYKVRTVSNGLQVSNNVMDKIAGELQGAKGDSFTSSSYETETGADIEKAMIISADNTGLELVDKDGKHLLLSSQDKNMVLHHYAINTFDEDGNPVTAVEAVDWRFDPEALMGYEVKSLKFYKTGENFKPGIVQVELVLHSPQYGDYTSERYINCYNIKEKSDIYYSSSTVAK
ncbi:MAG: prepilin-type N-terminal cleavage/methylation domain-containing protein [Eubacterium sp.]|nr:prepilin-type N-terminal cleavage/methylation domain-containing protein [Eubacterium sp.]